MENIGMDQSTYDTLPSEPVRDSFPSYGSSTTKSFLILDDNLNYFGAFYLYTLLTF
jgi:hypothetical protein